LAWFKIFEIFSPLPEVSCALLRWVSFDFSRLFDKKLDPIVSFLFFLLFFCFYSFFFGFWFLCILLRTGGFSFFYAAVGWGFCFLRPSSPCLKTAVCHSHFPPLSLYSPTHPFILFMSHLFSAKNPSNAISPTSIGACKVFPHRWTISLPRSSFARRYFFYVIAPSPSEGPELLMGRRPELSCVFFIVSGKFFPLCL